MEYGALQHAACWLPLPSNYLAGHRAGDAANFSSLSDFYTGG